MQKRPAFETLTSYEEFSKYYWYREELAAICRGLKLEASGTKQELNAVIEAYFRGERRVSRAAKRRRSTVEMLSLETPLLACGFAFNARFRAFFAEQTGVTPFKFTADMAAAWRKVKREDDQQFTLGDLLAVYWHASDYARYDASACEWNAFLRDFCADARNADCHEKLKTAALLWRRVKAAPQPKRYSYALVEEHRDWLRAKLAEAGLEE